MKIRALLAALAVLATASAARATATDDANAGLNALNATDYDRAVTLFTHAIDSRELHGDDEEFAYASRGRAYLKKGDLDRAIADLDRARREKPDDTDAQGDLEAALAQKLPADSIPGLPKASVWKAIGISILQGAAAGIVAGLTGDNGQ